MDINNERELLAAFMLILFSPPRQLLPSAAAGKAIGKHLSELPDSVWQSKVEDAIKTGREYIATSLMIGENKLKDTQYLEVKSALGLIKVCEETKFWRNTSNCRSDEAHLIFLSGFRWRETLSRMLLPELWSTKRYNEAMKKYFDENELAPVGNLEVMVCKYYLKAIIAGSPIQHLPYIIQREHRQMISMAMRPPPTLLPPRIQLSKQETTAIFVAGMKLRWNLRCNEQNCEKCGAIGQEEEEEEEEEEEMD